MAEARRYKSFIIANNVRSAVNVGSLFRIAESTGMGLILQGITPHPKTKNDDRLPYVIENDIKKISKTAVYSINKVEWYYFKTVEEVLVFLSSHSGGKIDQVKLGARLPIESAVVARSEARQSNPTSLYTLEEGVPKSISIYSKSLKLSKPFALVVGNEVSGVDNEFIKVSEKVLYLPMKGSQSSINVAVSTAVACFHLLYGIEG